MKNGYASAPSRQPNGEGYRMESSATLSVAFSPGVTVTKWTRIWAERHPQISLTVIPTDQLQQVAVVLDGTAQLSFVRLPINTEGLHVIPLYRERLVAVAAKDHLIAAAEAVTLADLAGETQQSASTKHGDRGAFDLVAAGVGVLVVPQSIARLHGRKDVVVRPITDAPETQIALVWRAGAGASADTDPDADAVSDGSPAARADLVTEFIGIVRGRTAQSSRSAGKQEGSPKKVQPAKAKGAAKAGSAAQRTGAAHAANRRRADARKKHRGR